MKLKVDFVTNSSSSSFVVMGTYLDTSKIPAEHLCSLFLNKLDGGDLTVDDMRESVSEHLDEILAGSDLTYSHGFDYYSESAMIGIPYTDMKDDETLAEFKTRVKIQIKNIFGFLQEVDHIEECWMDN